ncbi:MAG: hypothetical protein KME30_03570 [Iphinoe sp. HA4291-MV1]|jgi:hypothetical protein|nr:hypothetical protein [Iphinoe sp. HA4291-MV1]
MRRSISGLLTTLLLSAAILPAAAQAQTTEAEPTSLNPYVANQPSAKHLKPFNLAYLAYQGYLKDQGIPSNSALIGAIASGTITAQDIIQAAVKANRLPEQTLSDQGYRHNLEDQLQGFTGD